MKSPSIDTVFIFGALAAAIGAAAMFNYASVAAVLVWIGVVIAGLNKVLQLRHPRDEAYVATRAGFWLRRRAVMLTITVLLWLAAIGLGGLEAWRKLMQRTLTIEGVVLEPSGEAAAHARLEWDLRETSADADGKFRFETTFDARSLPRSVTVMARKGIRRQWTTVDVREGIASAEIVLPPMQPALPVRFGSVEGRQIDLLLEPPRELRIAALVNGNEVTYRNSLALATLSELRARFSRVVEHDELHFSRSDGRRGTVTVDYRPIRMFLGSTGEYAGNYNTPYLQRESTAAEVQSLMDPSRRWTVLQRDSYSDEIPGMNFLFRRPLVVGDLKSSDSLLAKFWLHVTNEQLPPGFGWVDLTAEDHCDAEPNPYFETTIVAPLMRLDVALFMNTTQQPIVFDTFQFRQNHASGLRPRETDDKTLAAARDELVPLHGFPLHPGQVLVVPLRLVMSMRGAVSGEYAYNEHFNDQLPSAIDLLRPTQYPRIGGSTFQSYNLLLAMERTAPRRPGELVYGPSAALTGVVVDGRAHEVRPVPEELPFASSSSPVGSCPYFAGFDGARWLSGGVILRGRSRAAWGGTDERPLPAFDGRVLIDERDPEVSTIDRVYVVAIDEAGRERILKPRDPRLLDADGRSVQLHRGDRLLVTFDAPPPDARRFRLGVTGYYELQ